MDGRYRPSFLFYSQFHFVFLLRWHPAPMARQWRKVRLRLGKRQCGKAEPEPPGSLRSGLRAPQQPTRPYPRPTASESLPPCSSLCKRRSPVYRRSLASAGRSIPAAALVSAGIPSLNDAVPCRHLISKTSVSWTSLFPVQPYLWKCPAVWIRICQGASFQRWHFFRSCCFPSFPIVFIRI